MKFGSLFSGIGGIDLGLERAGMSCAWQVEIDDYCQRILSKHWPNVPKFRDVREVGVRNLEPVDLIAGGFPCQDISNAGKREGIGGGRSGLWKEFHRIVCELRPRFVLVENVSALLVRGIDVVLGDLAESGYDAEWDCLPASAFGAPHQRDRVWIVAYSSRERQGRLQQVEGDERGEANPRHDGEKESLADTESERCGEAWRLRRDEPEERPAGGGEEVADPSSLGREQPWDTRTRGAGSQDIGSDVSNASSPRCESRGSKEGGEIRHETRGQESERSCGEVADADLERLERRVFDWGSSGQRPSWESGRPVSPKWEPEPNVGRVANGVSKRVDRLRSLGNAVVPQVVEWIGRGIVAK